MCGSAGHTPKGSYSPRGHSGHLLEIPFHEPLLRTLLRTFFTAKRKESQLLRTLLRTLPRCLPSTFSEPFLEACVLVRPPLGVHPTLKSEEGCLCRSHKKTKKTHGRVGTRSRAVSTQGSWQVCLSCCPKSTIQSISGFGKHLPAIFPRFSGTFLGNPGADPRNSHSLLEYSDQLRFNFV